MQVNGLNSSEYYWKMQLQKNHQQDAAGMTATVQNGNSIALDFQSMMDSYINSESNQNSENIAGISWNDNDLRSTIKTFNMMPLMMQMNSMMSMQNQTMTSDASTGGLLNSLASDAEAVSA